MGTFGNPPVSRGFGFGSPVMFGEANLLPSSRDQETIERIAMCAVSATLAKDWIASWPSRGRHLRTNIYRGAFTGGIRVDIDMF